MFRVSHLGYSTRRKRETENATRWPAMFGWILKTDWDIDRIIEVYRRRRIQRAAIGLDMEAEL